MVVAWDPDPVDPPSLDASAVLSFIVMEAFSVSAPCLPSHTYLLALARAPPVHSDDAATAAPVVAAVRSSSS
eukprot:4395697-Pyramimonas_sp.AAC.1